MMLRFAVLFYMALVLVGCCLVLLFVLHQVPLVDVLDGLTLVYTDDQLRLIFGAAAVIVLVKNYFFSRMVAGTRQREKTIAFDNPAGRVSVSVSAIEDLARRVIIQIPEVKDVRVNVLAGKGGLNVEARLVLNTEVNIPEMTASLQDLVRRRVQDTIGMEETVTVKVHVVKIRPKAGKVRPSKEKNPAAGAADQPAVPFQGYRA